MIGRIVFVLAMLLWLAALPLVAIGLGFSSFEILSPAGLVSDLAALPESWDGVALRLGVLLYLAFPFLGYRFLVGRPSNG